MARKKDFSKVLAEILAMEAPHSYVQSLSAAREKGNVKAALTISRAGKRLTVKELGALALAAKFIEGDNTATNLVLTAIGERPTEKEEATTPLKIVIENV